MGLKDDITRATVIELLTRPETLKPYETGLLQVGLRDLGFYKGNIDRAFKQETGMAAANFLSQPENRHFIQYASEQTQNAIHGYSDLLKEDAAKKRGMFDGIQEALGLKDKPKPVDDPYAKLFPNGVPVKEGAAPTSLDAIIAQPNSFNKADIEALQKAMKTDVDGTFGRMTSRTLVKHLTNHPADWATIGTPVLSMMLGDTDTRDALRAIPKPPEYYDRVSKLIAETKGEQGTNAVTYDLQVLLNAGNYYRSKDGKPSFSIPDGGPGDDTSNAIKVFNREKPVRKAELDNGEPAFKLADNSADGSSGPDVDVGKPGVAPAIEESARVAAAVTPPTTKFSV